MHAYELDLRFSIAQIVIREAGLKALNYFRAREELTIQKKGSQDRVSEADFEVEKEIRHQLTRSFPDDLFLGEESIHDFQGDSSKNRVWVVDPIDGTDCFVWGMPTWCLSIAWMDNGIVKIGVIYDPLHDEMFTAKLGEGTFLNGNPLKVSDAKTLEDGLVGIGYSTRVTPDSTLSALRKLMEAGGMFQRSGSGALSLAWVAAGRLLAYYEPHINSWDCLAGILLVNEAGGWTNLFLANDGFRVGNPIIASAPGITKEMQYISGLQETHKETASLGADS